MTKNIYGYLWLLLLAILFTLLFSLVSSPFIDKYMGDSSIFMTMGKMFLDGKIPYVDFFDHKGPVIILIEAFGQLFFSYRPGVLILEIINLFLILLVIKKIAGIVLERIGAATVVLLFLLLLSLLASQGNTSEQLSLLPIFLSLYVGCKYCFVRRKVTVKDAIILGLCFSSLFWLRANNAAVICAVTAFLFICSIVDKDYQSLKRLVFYFIIAQLPLAIIFIGYFSYHDALSELMYATFLYNLKYYKSSFNPINKYIWVNALVFILLAVGSKFHYDRYKDKKIIVFSTLLFVFCYLTINVGFIFRHYFILMCPPFVLGCILILMNIKSPKAIKNIYMICLAIFTGTCITQSVVIYIRAKKENPKTALYREAGKSLLDRIPQNEKGKVYYYQVDSQFYPIMGVNANYKYFILQEWQGSFDSNILTEINEMMLSNKKPVWVIVQKSEMKDSKNEKFKLILNDYYKILEENNIFILYKQITESFN